MSSVTGRITTDPQQNNVERAFSEIQSQQEALKGIFMMWQVFRSVVRAFSVIKRQQEALTGTVIMYNVVTRAEMVVFLIQ